MRCSSITYKCVWTNLIDTPANGNWDLWDESNLMKIFVLITIIIVYSSKYRNGVFRLYFGFA